MADEVDEEWLDEDLFHRLFNHADNEGRRTGYLIDSDWMMEFLGDRAEAVRLVRYLAKRRIAISVITYMELYEVIGSTFAGDESKEKFRKIMNKMVVIPLSPSIARKTAWIKAELRLRKRPVGNRALDLIIAATALEHDLELVSKNFAAYDDIPGLVLFKAEQMSFNSQTSADYVGE